MSLAVRRLLAVWLLIALACVLYWPTTLSYSVAWTDFDNMVTTHGYLIALMCIALLYMRREALAAPIPRGSVAVDAALALLGLLWLLAYRANIQTLHQLLFPIVLWTAIYAVFGRNIGRSCLFPVGFIYFALPAWGAINGLMQALTIAASEIILHWIRVPVQFEGNLVHIPDGTFAIEGGCSGLHFLVVALAIAAYYGALHRDTLRHRALLLVLAGVLALISNWIRVSIIITAGHLTHMQSYLVRVSHYGFGWSVFAVGMALFFLIASRVPLESEDAAANLGASHTDTRTWPAVATIVPALAALALGPALAWTAARGDAAAVAAPSLSQRVPGWEGPRSAPTDWRPIFIGADRISLATYRKDAIEVERYTADYRFQHQDKKLLGYYNSILGASGFDVLDQALVEHVSQQWIELQLRDAQGAQSLLWYAFRIGAREMTSGIKAELWYGVRSLAGPVDSRIMAFRAKCAPDCAAARQQLRQFLDGVCGTSRYEACRDD